MSIYSKKFSTSTNKDKNTSLSKIQNLINKDDREILDVGCSSGYLDILIKNKFNPNIWGIEINKNDSIKAKKNVDKILNIDIENYDLSKIKKKFDIIILADILEHLKNPEKILNNLTKLLKPKGRIIASIPNFLHFSIKIKILTDKWKYENYGLLDKTHLRFFSYDSIKKLFNSSHLHINYIDTVNSNISKKDVLMELIKAKLPTQTKIIKTIFSPQSLIFQYIITASKNNTKTFKNPITKNISINPIYSFLYPQYIKIKKQFI